MSKIQSWFAVHKKQMYLAWFISAGFFLLWSVITAVWGIDPSIQGGYFYFKSFIAVIWRIGLMLVMVFSIAVSFCNRALHTDRGQSSVFLPSFVWAIVMSVGAGLVVLETVLSLSDIATHLTKQVILQIFAWFLCSVYFDMSVFAPSHKMLRLIPGMAFCVCLLITMFLSYRNNYIPLNAPMKLLFQFSLVFVAFAMEQEMRSCFDDVRCQTLILSYLCCSVTSIPLGCMYLIAGLARTICGSYTMVVMLLCVGVYTLMQSITLYRDMHQEKSADGPSDTATTVESTPENIVAMAEEQSANNQEEGEEP